MKKKEILTKPIQPYAVSARTRQDLPALDPAFRYDSGHRIITTKPQESP